MSKTPKGLLLVVSGPSGAGKSTVLQEVMKDREDMFFSVSLTTRDARVGEVEGKHYYFTDKERFFELCGQGEMLEYAEYAGNLYGTPRAPVEERLRKGQIVVLDIETQGAMQVIRNCPWAVTVFLSPSSLAETERRLRARGTETEERIAARMKAALRECTRIGEYKYFVRNDDLPEAVQSLEAILKAERCRVDAETVIM